jgi:hypothetical protein
MSEGPGPVKPETVEALLETTRQLIREEDTRAESLNVRGGGLAGFAGLIAAVAGPLGAAALSDGLNRTVRYVVAIALVAALIALVGAVTAAIAGVLWPKTYSTLGMEEIERYPTYAYITQERVMVQGIALRGAISILTKQRSLNGIKAGWLVWGYRGLLTGIVLVAVATATLALDTAAA